MALEPGAQLGRYKVLRLLGAGAMGEVYLAEDPQIGRQLALKTVRIVAGSGHDKAELQERLVREARAAGRLIHPNIVTLFDAGESGGVFYLAFEFVDGVDLSDRLRGAPPLTVGEVLRIARQVAEGLDAAHRVGIVHRDIKPANILLDAEGQVKISDFGIAKMVGQTELTQTGSVVGSPHYLSPEQVRGEPLDGRSDLFSLGVVLYEMLTRLRPFEGETITTLVYQILSTEPASLSDARPQLPPNLARVVTRLLHKEAAHRFATGREFADALAQCERELPAELLASPAAGTVAEIAARRAAAATGSSGVRSPAGFPAPPPTEAPGGPPPPPPPVPSGLPASSSAVDMDTAATALLSRKDTAQVAAVPPVPPMADAGPVAASPSALPLSGARGGGRNMAVLAGVLFLLVALGVGGLFAWKSLQRPDRPEGLVAETEPHESVESDLATRPEAENADGTSAGWREVTAPEASSETATSELPEASRRVPVVDQDRPANGPAAEAPERLGEGKSGVAGRVEESETPSQRESTKRDAGSSSTQNSELKPAADREVTKPREEVTRQDRSRADSSPSAADLRPEPEPEPEIEVLPVDKTLSSSLSLRFDVTPDDTFVLIKEVTERRFISIGRAEEWSGKKDARVYDLPGPGEYYVRFRSQGRREVTYRVVASHGAGATPIVLRMQ